jgi:hypothetical protein
MEKIIERVRKLLELAKSSNVNEAAAAAAAAQKLMVENAITELMIEDCTEPEEEKEEIEKDVLNTDGKATWRGMLAICLCEANGCQCYVHGKALMIVGKPTPASAVRYLFEYIARQIETICHNEGMARGRPGRSWYNNFRLGAVSTIGQRLREAAQQARSGMRQKAYQEDTNGTGTALVKVNSAIVKLDKQAEEVKKWCKVNLRLHPRNTPSSYNHEGREAGKRAGANIDLGGSSHRGLGKGHRALLK